MIDKRTRVLRLIKSIERIEQQLASLNAHSDTFSWLRLAIFVGGVVVTLLAFFTFGICVAGGLLLLTIIVFSNAVYTQRQIKASILRHKIWITIKKRHIARIQLNWSQ